jgi:hypothetical protein
MSAERSFGEGQVSGSAVDASTMPAMMKKATLYPSVASAMTEVATGPSTPPMLQPTMIVP